VPGLRREEVAQLAHISTAWYTSLEQGRAVRATIGVLDAIADALDLDADARRYLHQVGGHPSDAAPDSEISPALGTFLASIEKMPAAIFTVAFDTLAWNDAYEVFHLLTTGLMPARGDNAIAAMFQPGPRDGAPATNAAEVMCSVLAQFRFLAAQYPDNPRFQQIIDQLNASSGLFRATWVQQRVSRTAFAGPIRVQHDRCGEIQFRSIQLRPVDSPALQLHIHVPERRGDKRAFQQLVREHRRRTHHSSRSPGREAEHEDQ
jgi:transcriptional regulator with XRE-family HTH domain